MVFGPAGRGTFHNNSDFDCLIIANGLPDGRMKRVEEFMNIEKNMEGFIVSLKNEGINTELSPIFKTPQEVKAGSPLFIDMIEDARILYDKDNFFAGILLKVKKRLEELGAKRIWKGDSWYWILKSAYRHGEEFEL